MTPSLPRPDCRWLSVLMPVHEGGRWLDQTLASVANQDCKGIEVIIRDSSAGTACSDIIQRYVGRLDINYLHCPDTKSWTRKTNMAAVEARGRHLAMLHQDDLWLPGRISAARAAIAAHPTAALLLSPSRIVDEKERPLGLWRCPLPMGRIPSDLLLERLLVQNFVAIPAPVIKHDAWLAVGGLDEDLWYTPDWDLYLKLACQGAAVYRGEVVTGFRIHSTSLTVTGSRNRADFAEQMLRVVHRHIEAIRPERRASTLKAALTSCAINESLAAAAGSGAWSELLKALAALLRLPPPQSLRYLRDSRLLERAWPRLRARLVGSL